MNHWLENSKKNLLPLSIAQNFSDALPEWRFTGTVLDYDGDQIICQLCEHPGLAHHFEIANKHNANTLLVGSSCILKFQEIEVRDVVGAVVSDQDERRFYLEEALRIRLREKMLEPLRDLYRRDETNRTVIAERAKALKRGDGVSPAALLFLFQRMQRHGIAFRPKLYKVSLRAFDARSELASMTRADRELIKPAFSSAQVKSHSFFFDV